MKFWWWNNVTNFGDILTMQFLNYFEIQYTFSIDFDAISIGSIATLAKPKTIVLGSGFLHSNDLVCNSADYRFVRGPFSRSKIIDAGGSCPEIYGDPCLMIPLIFDENTKIHDIGLVPHYSEYDQVKEMYPDFYVINVKNINPFETVKNITSCRSIISSSLHGIICAHAYSIPAAWVSFIHPIRGDGIKFKDHYASIGLDAIQSSIEDPLFTIGHSINIDYMINQFKSLK